MHLDGSADRVLRRRRSQDNGTGLESAGVVYGVVSSEGS